MVGGYKKVRTSNIPILAPGILFMSIQKVSDIYLLIIHNNITFHLHSLYILSNRSELDMPLLSYIEFNLICVEVRPQYRGEGLDVGRVNCSMVP